MPLAKLGTTEIVLKALLNAGIDIRTTKSTTDYIDVKSNKIASDDQVKAVLGNLTMPSGVPIKKVRIFIKDATIWPIRKGRPGETYVKPSSTHHLCIFKWEKNGKTKRGVVFVTRLEAAERLKNKNGSSGI